MHDTYAVAATDTERLRAAVAVRLGLDVKQGRACSLDELVRRRARVRQLDVADYLSLLEGDAADDELQALAQALTIPETYFFRDSDQFRALTGAVLPERIRARRPTRHLRLLSLGCASGEEAYSLALAARGAIDEPGWRISVTGIDVNAAALEKARAGRYSAWSLRGTRAPDVARWFRPSGSAFLLDDTVRAAVNFAQENLAAEPASWAVPDSWDVVFLRNVIMYFTPAQARALVGRVARAMTPGGYLFLGHAESLRGLSQAFALEHSHSAFYYRRAPVERGSASDDPAPGLGAATPACPPGDDWTEAIRRASQRVVDLIPAHKTAAAGDRGAFDLVGMRAQALELIANEEFGAAAALLGSLGHRTGTDPELALMRGVSLVQQGHIDMAVDLARALLARDHGHADAHHLLALCLECADDASAAMRQWRMCVHLEPGAGLARLHLGRLAQRCGDRDAAHAALSAALLLLPHESPTRLLLFGGGFSRAALLDLCRAELSRCGAGA